MFLTPERFDTTKTRNRQNEIEIPQCNVVVCYRLERQRPTAISTAALHWAPRPINEAVGEGAS